MSAINPTPASYTLYDLDANNSQNFQYVEKTTYNTTPMGTTVTTTQGKKVGLMARISHSAKNLVDRASETLGFSNDTNSRWAMFGIQDPLMAEFPCKLVNVDKFMRGYMYISNSHLCYASHADAQNRIVKFVLPLTQIQQVRQSQKLRTTKGALPTFVPIANQQGGNIGTIKPDSIQVIDNNNLLHTFYGLGSQYLNCFNVLNHTWCTARGVQAPGLAAPIGTGLVGTTTTGTQQPVGYNQNPIPTATYNTQSTQFVPNPNAPIGTGVSGMSAAPVGTAPVPVQQQGYGVVDPLMQKHEQQQVFPTTTTTQQTTTQQQYPLQK